VVTTGSAEPAAALPAMAPPAMVPAAMAQAPAMAPPSAATAVPIGSANNAALVTALIDLSDRVPSQALRAEILAALGRAGVHALVPEVGGAFDATRMRGVGGVPAPEAGWAGRVASVERTGFHDGVSVLRVPEVVVYTVGS
jgi:outer membrane protein TolC